jgi:hypothetical protein
VVASKSPAGDVLVVADSADIVVDSEVRELGVRLQCNEMNTRKHQIDM